MKPKLFKEGGQALIIIALAAIALFGIAGLAIDGSAKFSDRRHAQNAADAAALAAALSKGAGADETTWKFKAKQVADDNGYDSNLVSNTVTVYNCTDSGSSCGAYAGSDEYVQVIITSTVNTSFSRVLGISQTQNTVQAVAHTRQGGPLFDGASIVSLNPSPNCSGGSGSGGGSVDVGGNGTINLNGGGIFVNSSASCGYSQTSCSVTLNVAGGAGITSAGSAINVGCASSVPQDTTGESVVIPHEVNMPDRPAECSQTAIPPNLLGVDANGVQNWLIHPGYYTDFPQAGLVPNNKNVFLEPGVYCVDSNIHWSGSTFKSLDGRSGVTIYLTAGHDFSTNINSPIWLDPSTSGEYAGYLMIMDGDHNSIENCTINGGSYLDMNGTIFAPYCSITINGDNSTSSEFNAQIIGWNIKLNGNNTINFTYDPSVNAELKRRIGLMK
jgi:Flp pilus assembly protein TadG